MVVLASAYGHRRTRGTGEPLNAPSQRSLFSLTSSSPHALPKLCGDSWDTPGA